MPLMLRRPVLALLLVFAVLSGTLRSARAQEEVPLAGKVALPVVPAQVAGLWCGEGLLHEARLELAQHYQEFDGTLRHRQRSRHVEGSIEGNILRTPGGSAGELVLEVQGVHLRIRTAGGPLALAQGMGFRRAVGEHCS
jgi:hypothetical protein